MRCSRLSQVVGGGDAGSTQWRSGDWLQGLSTAKFSLALGSCIPRAGRTAFSTVSMVSAVALGVASESGVQIQVQSNRSPESLLVSGSMVTVAKSDPSAGSSMVRTGAPPRRISRLVTPRSERLAAMAAQLAEPWLPSGTGHLINRDSTTGRS